MKDATEYKRGIICAGNWIVDIVHEIEQWPRKSDLTRIRRETRGVGGGAANVAMALARLRTGLPLFPFGAIGHDSHAQFIIGACETLGLPTDFLLRRTDVPTAHSHVMSVPGDSRTFFYQGGANDLLAPEDFTDSLFSATGARIFYLGYPMLLKRLDRSFGLHGSGTADVLAHAKAAGLVTCVDLVSTEWKDYAEVVGHMLGQIDYLVVNEVEAGRASGVERMATAGYGSDAHLIQAAQRILARGGGKAVIIHCPEKALWLGRDGRITWERAAPLPREKIVSPVGAGDAFCAGILLALHEDWSADTALTLAHTTARASLSAQTATDAIPPLSDLRADLSATLERAAGYPEQPKNENQKAEFPEAMA